MLLQSKLFRNDPKLEAAAVSDSAHIVPGARGDHVRKIQLALIKLDGAAITADGVYGPATAAAVLAFKQKRNIIDCGYQTKADNIVGKMTMAALDREMLAKETPTPEDQICVLDAACPCDRPQPRGIQLNFAFEASIGGRQSKGSSSILYAVVECQKFYARLYYVIFDPFTPLFFIIH